MGYYTLRSYSSLRGLTVVLGYCTRGLTVVLGYCFRGSNFLGYYTLGSNCIFFPQSAPTTLDEKIDKVRKRRKMEVSVEEIRLVAAADAASCHGDH